MSAEFVVIKQFSGRQSIKWTLQEFVETLANFFRA